MFCGEHNIAQHSRLRVSPLASSRNDLEQLTSSVTLKQLDRGVGSRVWSCDSQETGQPSQIACPARCR